MITFLGDVALLNDKLSSEYKPSQPYIFNFEYTTGDNRYDLVEGKINLYSANHDLKSVFGSLPEAVVISNNHIFDFGKEGYEQTLETLHSMGVATIGDDEFWLNDEICLLSYSLVGGAPQLDFEYQKVKNQIYGAKNNGAKRIIVNVHWGIENHPNTNKQQREVGHWLLDNGVDLVIGHHPHCIQPIECYNGKYICYSLGNCLFPNFSLKSHFYNGKATRNYNLRWRSWNRKSLAIHYNEATGDIAVDELYMSKNNLKCKKSNVGTEKYKETLNPKLAKLVFTFRKYYLFFVSNLCIDGKLFDLSAVKAELNKK